MDFGFQKCRTFYLQQMMRKEGFMHLTPLTDEDFQTAISAEKKPVIVEFYVKWSGSCIIADSILQKIVPKYNALVKFYRINTQENAEAAKKYGVYKIPAILIFHNGQLVDSFTGTFHGSIIEQKIQNLL
jgi:thioredoxin